MVLARWRVLKLRCLRSRNGRCSFQAHGTSCFEDSPRPAIVAGGKRRLKTQRLPESEVFGLLNVLHFGVDIH